MLFIAKPDYYGRFGHQILRHLFSIILADIYNGKFFPLRIGYSAHRFEGIIKLDKHPLASQIIQSGHIESLFDYQNGINEKFCTEDRSGYKNLVNSITDMMNRDISAVFLPFDQHPGIAEKHLARMRESLISIIETPEYNRISGLIDQSERKRKSDYPFIVRAHLRRGDISSDGVGSNMFTTDSIMTNCLGEINTKRPDSFVNLYTQGSRDWALNLLLQAGFNEDRCAAHIDNSLWTTMQK